MPDGTPSGDGVDRDTGRRVPLGEKNPQEPRSPTADRNENDENYIPDDPFYGLNDLDPRERLEVARLVADQIAARRRRKLEEDERRVAENSMTWVPTLRKRDEKTFTHLVSTMIGKSDFVTALVTTLAVMGIFHVALILPHNANSQIIHRNTMRAACLTLPAGITVAPHIDGVKQQPRAGRPAPGPPDGDDDGDDDSPGGNNPNWRGFPGDGGDPNFNYGNANPEAFLGGWKPPAISKWSGEGNQRTPKALRTFEDDFLLLQSEWRVSQQIRLTRLAAYLDGEAKSRYVKDFWRERIGDRRVNLGHAFQFLRDEFIDADYHIVA